MKPWVQVGQFEYINPILRTIFFSLMKGFEPFCQPYPHRKMAQIWFFQSRSLFSIYIYQYQFQISNFCVFHCALLIIQRKVQSFFVFPCSYCLDFHGLGYLNWFNILSKRVSIPFDIWMKTFKIQWFKAWEEKYKERVLADITKYCQAQIKLQLQLQPTRPKQ